MSFPRSMPLLRHGSFFAALLVLSAGFARAQSAPVANSAASTDASGSAASFSSSSIDGLPDAEALSAAVAAEGAAVHGAQDDRYAAHRGALVSHLTFEAGGGFNAPDSDTSPYVTWGGNFNLGAGYRFNPYLSLLAEYQFIDDKLPGRLIAETGADGGNAHIWSFTLDPVIDLFPKQTNSIYVTGGGGFYRKVTNFTDPVDTEYCDYFYCYGGTENVVVGHFSSNQGGWNIGAGYTHRLGSGLYGESRMKLFAEARYLHVNTPGVYSSPNGLGITTVAPDTVLIPVTLGVRW